MTFLCIPKSKSSLLSSILSRSITLALMLPLILTGSVMVLELVPKSLLSLSVPELIALAPVSFSIVLLQDD